MPQRVISHGRTGDFDFVAPPLGLTLAGSALEGIGQGFAAGAAIKGDERRKQQMIELAGQYYDAMIEAGVSQRIAALSMRALAAKDDPQAFMTMLQNRDKAVAALKKVESETFENLATASKTNIEAGLAPGKAEVEATYKGELGAESTARSGFLYGEGGERHREFLDDIALAKSQKDDGRLSDTDFGKQTATERIRLFKVRKELRKALDEAGGDTFDPAKRAQARAGLLAPWGGVIPDDATIDSMAEANVFKNFESGGRLSRKAYGDEGDKPESAMVPTGAAGNRRQTQKAIDRIKELQRQFGRSGNPSEFIPMLKAEFPEADFDYVREVFGQQ